MFSYAKKTTLAAMVLIFASSVATAQEPKDNNAPVGPGQGPDTVVGPDAFGYTVYDDAEAQCTYDFIDITATGVEVASGDDVSSGPVALGGAGIEFYGDVYTSLVAATNGYISTDPTDAGPDLSNDCPLPVAPSTGGGARMYPLHDDLVTNSLLFEYFADCPRPGPLGAEGCNIFQWNEVTHFSSDVEFNFQVILYEETNSIIFQHGSGNPELGSGSTTGIQNLGNSIGLTYACNTADSVADNTAQCIYDIDFIGVDGAAGFTVNKDFDDDNPAEVEVTISCNTGLPLTQSDTIAEGDSVTFIVGDFEDGELDCEITEGGADGYTASYDNGTTASDTSCLFLDSVIGIRYTCDIANSLDLVDVEVTKWWMDENPQFDAVNFAEATYNCVNEQFGTNVYGSLEFLGDGAVDGFSVYPDWDGSTTCTVSETVVEGGIEFDDSECASLSVTPGVGASCNIYNTRLYEGIPTLSQYGLALMALLMLGVGFVAFRRVA